MGNAGSSGRPNLPPPRPHLHGVPPPYYHQYPPWRPGAAAPPPVPFPTHVERHRAVAVSAGVNVKGHTLRLERDDDGGHLLAFSFDTDVGKYAAGAVRPRSPRGLSCFPIRGSDAAVPPPTTSPVLADLHVRCYTLRILGDSAATYYSLPAEALDGHRLRVSVAPLGPLCRLQLVSPPT